jgi:hypothetical protein
LDGDGGLEVYLDTVSIVVSVTMVTGIVWNKIKSFLLPQILHATLGISENILVLECVLQLIIE